MQSKKGQIVVKYIFEVMLLSLAVMLTAFQKIGWYEAAILGLLSIVVVELIAQSTKSESLFKGVSAKISGVNLELRSLASNVQLKNAHDELMENIRRVSHPYFVSLLSHKINGFVEDNINLFNGRHSTSPFKSDTYGADGLLNTKDNLKCVSSFSDYWDDRRNSDYYAHQVELVKGGIRIQRLFVVNDSNEESARREMKRQKEDGIEVRSINQHIFGGNEFFRDYLIQDNCLLVDLVPKCARSPKHSESIEIISTNGVNERIAEFNKFWGHADRA